MARAPQMKTTRSRCPPPEVPVRDREPEDVGLDPVPAELEEAPKDHAEVHVVHDLEQVIPEEVRVVQHEARAHGREYP